MGSWHARVGGTETSRPPGIELVVVHPVVIYIFWQNPRAEGTVERRGGDCKA